MQEYLEWSLKRFVRARRILISRPPEPLLLSTSRTGESARSLSFHSPSLHCPRSAISCRGQFDSCANEPEAFLDRRQRSEPPHSNAAVFNSLRSYGLIGLLLVALPGFGAVREVRSIGLAVNNLDREVAFFTSVLP